jgi:hypothetical protein
MNTANILYHFGTPGLPRCARNDHNRHREARRAVATQLNQAQKNFFGEQSHEYPQYP